ncbi:MAG: thioredoxin family protein [Pseudomonadota bacterium]
MKTIKILGTGCAKCKKLAEVADTAAKNLALDYEIEKVTDIAEIVGYGVMITPALVVDGQVKVAGKVPSVDEVKKMLA